MCRLREFTGNICTIHTKSTSKRNASGDYFAETLYVHKTNREIDLLSLTAEEQYLQLLQKNPKLVNTISVKHLASYLGIQLESLSRIRQKVSSIS